MCSFCAISPSEHKAHYMQQNQSKNPHKNAKKTLILCNRPLVRFLSLWRNVVRLRNSQNKPSSLLFTQKKYSSAFNQSASRHSHIGSLFTNKDKEKVWLLTPWALLPNMPVLFMMSRTQTGGHKMATLMVKFFLVTFKHWFFFFFKQDQKSGKQEDQMLRCLTFKCKTDIRYIS